MDLRIGERDAGATRAAIPSPPLPTALRFFSVGFGGGRRDDSGHDGGKNKRRDVNEIKRVRGMYLRSG